MKRSFYCLVIILTVFIISCGQGKNSPVQENTVTVQLPFDDGTLKMSDIADSIHYIPLETDTACLIGQIDKLIPLDTAFVVVDKEVARSVYLFGRDGRFIRRIGHAGPGPQEYVAIEDVAVDQERGQIVILDLNSQHFLVYSLDGSFVKSVRFDFYVYDIESLGGGKIAGFLNYGNNRNLEKQGLAPTSMIYDLDNEKITGLYTYADKDIHSSSILNFSTNLLSDGVNTELIIPLNDTIFSVTQEGIAPKYLLDFGQGQNELQKEYVSYIAANQPNASLGPKKAEDMGLAQLAGAIITEKNNLFSYRKNEKPYMAIRNNETGHIKSIRIQDLSSLLSDMDHITLFIPYGADKDNLYLMVNPYALAELPQDKQNNQTCTLKASFSEEDNPVIAVARMKDF